MRPRKDIDILLKLPKTCLLVRFLFLFLFWLERRLLKIVIYCSKKKWRVENGKNVKTSENNSQWNFTVLPLWNFLFMKPYQKVKYASCHYYLHHYYVVQIWVKQKSEQWNSYLILIVHGFQIQCLMINSIIFRAWPVQCNCVCIIERRC